MLQSNISRTHLAPLLASTWLMREASSVPRAIEVTTPTLSPDPPACVVSVRLLALAVLAADVAVGVDAGVAAVDVPWPAGGLAVGLTGGFVRRFGARDVQRTALLPRFVLRCVFRLRFAWCVMRRLM